MGAPKMASAAVSTASNLSITRAFQTGCDDLDDPTRLAVNLVGDLREVPTDVGGSLRTGVLDLDPVHVLDLRLGVGDRSFGGVSHFSSGPSLQ